MFGLFGSRRKSNQPSTTPDAVTSGPWEDEARRLLAAGDKLGAITIVRQGTNLGLAQAKALVESWQP
jgi:ribosomal protein L7/L12